MSRLLLLKTGLWTYEVVVSELFCVWWFVTFCFDFVFAVIVQNKVVPESAPPGRDTALRRPSSSSTSLQGHYHHKSGSAVGSDFTIPKYVHVHLPASPLRVLQPLNHQAVVGGAADGFGPAVAVSRAEPAAAVPIIPRRSDSSVFPQTHIAVHVAPSDHYRPHAVGILTDTNGLGVAALSAEQDRLLQTPASLLFKPRAQQQQQQQPFEGMSELIDLGRDP